MTDSDSRAIAAQVLDWEAWWDDRDRAKPSSPEVSPDDFWRIVPALARALVTALDDRADFMRDAIAARALPPELEAIALTSLLEAADRVDSTTGVQMAYLKQWAPRAFNDLELRMPAVLPRPAEDRTAAPGAALWPAFVETFTSFFRRRDIALVLAFLLLFRLGEAQLVKLLAPFLLDPRAQGGLGLSTAQLGIAYGTFGVAALTLGGLLGGLTISRFGLKRCLWPMVAAIHTPNLLYFALALWQPDSLALVTAAVAAEQLGYGFGFAAYLMFMIHVADGEHKTAHYALCTGFMALGMMLPGMASGWLQQQMGYTTFFVWVCVATLPSVAVAAMLKIPPEFGRKQEEADASAAAPSQAAAGTAPVSPTPASSAKP
jgi:hypothetical protein